MRKYLPNLFDVQQQDWHIARKHNASCSHPRTIARHTSPFSANCPQFDDGHVAVTQLARQRVPHDVLCVAVSPRLRLIRERLDFSVERPETSTEVHLDRVAAVHAVPTANGSAQCRWIGQCRFQFYHFNERWRYGIYYPLPFRVTHFLISLQFSRCTSARAYPSNKSFNRFLQQHEFLGHFNHHIVDGPHIPAHFAGSLLQKS